MPFDISKISEAFNKADLVRIEGRVLSVVGLAIHSLLPGAKLGEVAKIERKELSPLLAEVVGFQDRLATLLPLGSTEGISSESRVIATGETLKITFGPKLLGRVLDGLGNPIDGGPPLEGIRREIIRHTYQSLCSTEN